MKYGFVYVKTHMHKDNKQKYKKLLLQKFFLKNPNPRAGVKKILIPISIFYKMH